MLTLFPQREVAFSLAGLQIRWYGLLYVISFWFAWWILPKLQVRRDLHLSRDDWTFVAALSAAGVLVGGRLGYVLFYEPAYFLQYPGEVVAIWQGGMSSHGGFIGVAIGLYIASRYLHVDIWKMADIAVVPVAVGLALGRLGNWINQELYVGNMALLVAAVHLSVCGGALYLLRRNNTPGLLFGAFLTVYGVQRLLFEEFRHLEWPTVLDMSRGQLLTLPVLCISLWVLYLRAKTTSGKK